MERHDYDITVTVQLRAGLADAIGRRPLTVRVTDPAGKLLAEKTGSPDDSPAHLLLAPLWDAIGDEVNTLATDEDKYYEATGGTETSGHYDDTVEWLMKRAVAEGDVPL